MNKIGDYMKKKRKKKASGNRLIVFGTVSIFIIFSFVFCLLSYIIEVKNLNEEQKKLDNDLLILKEEESDLKNEIEKLKDPDYLARFARENYMYSKDGEYIIKVSEKEEKEVNIKNEEKSYLKFTLIISVIAFLVLFIKKIV